MRPRTTTSDCKHCGLPFILPLCRVGLLIFCDKACGVAYREAIKESRRTACLVCGTEFYPRPGQVAKGRGKFCSQKCHGQFNAGKPHPKQIPSISDEEYKRRQRELYHRNRDRYLATKRERNQQRMPLLVAKAREYRAANRDKVREWRHNRRGREMGALPSGTVSALLKNQRGKCAICKRDISKCYTLDHITPLAKGGAHTARNLQLLCRSCNSRKNTKDPVEHMQSLGYLL